MPRRRLRRRGFILPTTLLVLALLTVMLTAAFILVSAEHRTTDNAFGGNRALALAGAGLSNYFATPRTITLFTTWDSVRFAMPGGYADVVARRLVPATTNRPALWAIRSTGVSTTSVLRGQVQGRRTVGQLAELVPGTLPARAAMVAANGVQFVATGDNPLEGSDACWPASDTTAVTVPVGGIRDSATSGARPAPTPVEQLATAGTVYDSTRIDWARLLTGDFSADYVAPAPCLDALQLVPGSYPSGFCNGNATLTGWRRGLLVVTGDVDLADRATWDGILIVGGRLTTPSGGGTTFRVRGMVITGLNLSQGTQVPANRLRRGNNRDIQFASCLVAASTRSLTSFAPVRSGWVGGWTQY